jgi:hypothetical protein
VGDAIYGFAYGSPVEQRVVVVVDSTGRPVRYSDVRGDLRLNHPGQGDFTMIVLNLHGATALVRNNPAQGEAQLFRGEATDLLHSEVYGDPAARIEEVLRTCRRAS